MKNIKIGSPDSDVAREEAPSDALAAAGTVSLRPSKGMPASTSSSHRFEFEHYEFNEC